MPTLFRDDQSEMFYRVEIFINLRKGLIGHFLFDAAAFGVGFIEKFCNLPGFTGIVGYEQPKGLHRLSDTSGRVDARTELETEMIGIDLSVYSCNRLERAQALPFCCTQHVQSMVDDDPVFTDQRYNVRDGSKRNDVEIVAQIHLPGGRVSAGAPGFEQRM